MLIAELARIGPPEDVVALVERPDPSPPGSGEALVRMEVCPINPADLLLIEGRYAATPETPCPLGIEGVGCVEAVGAGVSSLKPGDRVMCLGRANWAQAVLGPAESFVRLPDDVDPEQAAMLKVNGATAARLLRDFVDLAAGDWVMQNAANSGVGHNVIRMAARAGVRTVNIVRRDALVAPLKNLGADVVLVDGPDLADRVRDAVDGEPVRLAFDAVAGDLVDRMAGGMADGGTIVNYGLMSGEPCRIAAGRLIFGGVQLTGFWLARLLGQLAPAELQTFFGGLMGNLRDGTIHAPVEARYSFDRLGEALAHANRGARAGKVLIHPNREG
ncbi:zinc-dependent alcohol dehydrogenase family protein [Marivibrio halodurans]|uniref:enoyl-[acyl-carrier-protein] reductase n=1 Tax=Marivibrio halodurans TaxID=2039722 RepID=A0A8J7V0T9_9PROT|nr:zinc-dependent alcohol dehydrogenase family protein [Marivibrio halodurans]MBP5857131.1 zinc-dependent alcohol dehydrogenase family protein [Marivibrio halodurans]